MFKVIESWCKLESCRFYNDSAFICDAATATSRQNTCMGPNRLITCRVQKFRYYIQTSTFSWRSEHLNTHKCLTVTHSGKYFVFCHKFYIKHWFNWVLCMFFFFSEEVFNIAKCLFRYIWACDCMLVAVIKVLKKFFNNNYCPLVKTVW